MATKEMKQQARTAAAVLAHRRYARCRSDDDQGVEDRILAALVARKPLTVVGYWGVGDRSLANGIDVQALDHLAAVQAALGVASRFVLLSADAHGYLNGEDDEAVLDYLSAINQMANERFFEFHWLSFLWREWGLRPPFGSVNEEEWQVNPLAPILEGRSAKHYRGSLSHREDAQRYWLMARRERDLVAGEFPGAIWWTYSSPEFAAILANMPRVYLWSTRKGNTHPPWFMG